LAGLNLDPERPAFERIVIRPNPVGDLKWIRAERQSVYGPIRIEGQYAVFSVGSGNYAFVAE
jgi:hypothetical protein